MNKSVTILRSNPTVIPIAEMRLIHQGLNGVLDWVRSHRPECVPDEVDDVDPWKSLFPHDLRDSATGRALTDNELLVEFAGRKSDWSGDVTISRESSTGRVEHRLPGVVIRTASARATAQGIIDLIEREMP
jgi:hypothetical protein